MKMSSPYRKSGVLKLVHPGGFVEIHKNPVIAAEVMKKNPRHCVTRPDVFKYPWIVVSPESVLKPGNVFFIVPYHTIHRLLQEYGSQNHFSFKQHQEDFRPGRVKLTTKMELWAEDEVIRQSRPCRHGHDPTESLIELTNFHCFLKKQAASQNKANDKHEDLHEDFFTPKCLADQNKKYQYNNYYFKKQSPIKSLVEMKTQQDSDESLEKRYSFDYWPKAFARCKSVQKTKQQSPVKSFVEPGKVLSPKYDGGFELNSSQKVIKLKSCLKKNEKNKIPKSRSSRVMFFIPEDEENKLRLDSMEFPRIETP